MPPTLPLRAIRPEVDSRSQFSCAGGNGSFPASGLLLLSPLNRCGAREALL